MKDELNSELNNAIESGSNTDNDMNRLIEEAENLQKEASGASSEQNSESELAGINKRLEDLIKEISTLNNKNS
jgi:hypothetical protein